MRKKIALVFLAVTAFSFTISCSKTNRKLENLNAATGNNESLEFSQDLQMLPNNNGNEPTEENVRVISLSPTNKEIIEIKEKMFIAQTNDVYLNAEDYLGKTIKLEGLFKQDDGYGKTYSFVIRYGPGCCGYDGTAGFEVAWTNEKNRKYPAVDSWVEATGVLKTYQEDSMQYLYLDLASLNVLSKRGAETVLQ
jgi:uncharacterized membrane protein YcgQ (UPF0703/DUF1980 family)